MTLFVVAPPLPESHNVALVGIGAALLGFDAGAVGRGGGLTPVRG